MQDYKLYYTTRNGHIVDVVELRARDTEEAVARGEALADGRAMELWLGSERLQAWPADESLSPRSY